MNRGVRRKRPLSIPDAPTLIQQVRKQEKESSTGQKYQCHAAQPAPGYFSQPPVNTEDGNRIRQRKNKKTRQESRFIHERQRNTWSSFSLTPILLHGNPSQDNVQLTMPKEQKKGEAFVRRRGTAELYPAASRASATTFCKPSATRSRERPMKIRSATDTRLS